MENILDYELLNEVDKQARTEIEGQLLENEKLIWFTQPKYEFTLTPLEVGGHDVALGPTNLYFIALGISWFCSYKSFNDEHYMKSAFLFLLGLIIFSLPDIIKEIRRRNTFYAISNKRIFFKLWGIRKSKRNIEFFDLASINDVRYEEYKDKSGILHFLLKDPPSFKTYDFSAGGSRHYPTFENVDEVIKVHGLIWKTIKESR